MYDFAADKGSGKRQHVRVDGWMGWWIDWCVRACASVCQCVYDSFGKASSSSHHVTVRNSKNKTIDRFFPPHLCGSRVWLFVSLFEVVVVARGGLAELS